MKTVRRKMLPSPSGYKMEAAHSSETLTHITKVYEFTPQNETTRLIIALTIQKSRLTQNLQRLIAGKKRKIED
jgi:hypothetical protein